MSQPLNPPTRGVRAVLFTIALTISLPLAAQAHFIWVVQGEGGQVDQLNIYFGELAEADDPALLSRITKAKLWRLDAQGKASPVPVAMGTDSLVAKGGAGASLYLLTHDLGVISRGGETFLLRYYAKTGPALGHPAWDNIDCGKRLALDLVPKRAGDNVSILVRWRGKPLAGAQVIVNGPGMENLEVESDAKGRAEFPVTKNGVFSIRARHIEQQGGQRDGTTFKTTRHYSTLALRLSDAAASVRPPAVSTPYPAIPEMVTSFGAAVVDDALYAYGGHTGGAHSYSKGAQAKTLRRLSLKRPIAWESLGEGPGLQGLALVAHGGKLYRLGGFTARNPEGEEHDLWSQDDVARYDPESRAWSAMKPLPEPRSSFDAAVLGDKLYVIGGWQMAGDAEAIWHQSAYVMNLESKSPKWESLAKPPFQRRALSVAAHQGKIYAIGGMQPKGGPTTRVDVFDPATRQWSLGPSLIGKPMDGFGSSAFAVGDRLFVSTYSGKLLELSQDGGAWDVVAELERARFFHRMLPLPNGKLILLGGASMSVGKFAELDVINVSPSVKPATGE